MPNIDAIFAVLLAGLSLSAIPGPSMLYVLSRSVGQSRAAGLASALGLALGGVVLAVATALGLASVFENFPKLAVALRYIGSAYLIWLGIGMIRDALMDQDADLRVEDLTQMQPFRTIVWQGVLVELFNPKTVLFFALFLPPFVDLETGNSVTLQFLILGVLIPLTAIPSDILLAYMGGTFTQTIREQRAYRNALAWAGGLVLIFIAVNLHFQIL